MKTLWSRLLLCVAVAGSMTVLAVAQDSSADANNKDSVRTLTGCLSKGDSATEYLLTANDGSTWEIHANNSVDLASHLNQTVEAKGVVKHNKMHNMKEDAKDMASDTGMKKNSAEHGHLEVTDVHKVSDSCQK